MSRTIYRVHDLNVINSARKYTFIIHIILHLLIFIYYTAQWYFEHKKTSKVPYYFNFTQQESMGIKIIIWQEQYTQYIFTKRNKYKYIIYYILYCEIYDYYFQVSLFILEFSKNQTQQRSEWCLVFAYITSWIRLFSIIIGTVPTNILRPTKICDYDFLRYFMFYWY